jgi:transcriptional regulator with XRE-family HTH domain
MSEADKHTVLDELGSAVETKRRDLRRSAREVADAAGISAVYLRVIETGLNPKTGRASRPSPEVVVRLARALGMPPDALLALAGYQDLRADIQADHGPHGAVEGESDGELHALANALRLLKTRPSDFMRQVALEDLASFEAHIAAIASGSLLCSPGDDARIRGLALTNACRVSLRAISYGDDGWWLSSRSADFVDRCGDLFGRGSTQVTRIFLLEPSERHVYASALEQHAAIGAEVLIADPSAVAEASRRDLEIYDQALLREATLAAPAGGRFAEFTDDPSRLQRAEVAFEAARRVARAP